MASKSVSAPRAVPPRAGVGGLDRRVQRRWGLDYKRKLLALEGVELPGDAGSKG
jgi:hypothetical protein